MAKDPKHIKVNMSSGKPVFSVMKPGPTLPPVNDLVLNFSSDKYVYTIRVKAEQMGNAAAAFCALLKHYEVAYTVEEKPR
jgi:hypothetical protein